uniref:Macro domain-containing protein n=1 Tax=Labrus bergylta TaxID=56723 RepID=A0A3Q3FQT1_9LABR
SFGVLWIPFDGCIHKAAGSCLYDECHSLNGCETGKAKITCGYDLPARCEYHVYILWALQRSVLTHYLTFRGSESFSLRSPCGAISLGFFSRLQSIACNFCGYPSGITLRQPWGLLHLRPTPRLLTNDTF